MIKIEIRETPKTKCTVSGGIGPRGAQGPPGAGGSRIELTADAALTADDAGNAYTNAAAAIATLPPSASLAAAAWSARFFVTTAQTLRVKAQGSDVIRYTTAVSAAAGSLESSVIGSCLEVEYVGGGVFFVTQAMDAWEFA